MKNASDVKQRKIKFVPLALLSYASLKASVSHSHFKESILGRSQGLFGLNIISQSKLRLTFG